VNDEQLGIEPEDEEVEGHKKVPVRDAQDDDVEGHKKVPVREAPDDDDVEGHIRQTGGRG
jgi:hypothetical protein